MPTLVEGMAPFQIRLHTGTMITRKGRLSRGQQLGDVIE